MDSEVWEESWLEINATRVNFFKMLLLEKGFKTEIGTLNSLSVWGGKQKLDFIGDYFENNQMTPFFIKRTSKP